MQIPAMQCQQGLSLEEPSVRSTGDGYERNIKRVFDEVRDGRDVLTSSKEAILFDHTLDATWHGTRKTRGEDTR